MSDPLSLNLYTYCHNEPIMYTDPTGHISVNTNGMTFYIDPSQSEDREFMRFYFKEYDKTGNQDSHYYIDKFDTGKAANKLYDLLEQYRFSYNSITAGNAYNSLSLTGQNLIDPSKALYKMGSLFVEMLQNKVTLEDAGMSEAISGAIGKVMTPEYIDMIEKKMGENEWYHRAIHVPQLDADVLDYLSLETQESMHNFLNEDNILLKIMYLGQSAYGDAKDRITTFSNVQASVYYDSGVIKDPEMAKVAGDTVAGVFAGAYLEGSLNGFVNLGKATSGVRNTGKTIDIYEFLSVKDKKINAQLAQSKFGHVGFSFNKGKTIFGFGPTGNGITGEALYARKVFPGKVTNDTMIFRDAKSLGLDVQIKTYDVTYTQYWKARLGVLKDRVMGRFSGKMYSFPPERGSGLPWAENTYNCATYPKSVGLPTTHESGYLRD